MSQTKNSAISRAFRRFECCFNQSLQCPQTPSCIFNSISGEKLVAKSAWVKPWFRKDFCLWSIHGQFCHKMYMDNMLEKLSWSYFWVPILINWYQNSLDVAQPVTQKCTFLFVCWNKSDGTDLKMNDGCSLEERCF